MSANTGGDRPAEMPAVKTTIVGGRPPGPGKAVGDVPRGIEVLVKKAAVDPAFKARLLEARADAADEIDLSLDPAEAAMLAAIPHEQLDAIIAGTKVDAKTRPAFLGKAAAVMIAALGVAGAGCKQDYPAPTGSRPPKPSNVKPVPDGPEKSDEKVDEEADAGSTDGDDAKPVAPPKDRITRGMRPR